MVPTLEVKMPGTGLLDDLPMHEAERLQMLFGSGDGQDHVMRQSLERVQHLLANSRVDHLNLDNLQMGTTPGINLDAGFLPDYGLTGIDSLFSNTVLQFSKSLGHTPSMHHVALDPRMYWKNVDQRNVIPNQAVIDEMQSDASGFNEPKSRKRRRKSDPPPESQPKSAPVIAVEDDPATKITNVAEAKPIVTKCVASIIDLVAFIDGIEISVDLTSLEKPLKDSKQLMERAIDQYGASELISAVQSEDPDALHRLIGMYEDILKEYETLGNCWNPRQSEEETDDIERKFLHDVKSSLVCADVASMALSLLLGISLNTSGEMYSGESLISASIQFLKIRIEDMMLTGLKILEAVGGSASSKAFGLPRLQRQCMKVLMFVFAQYETHRHSILEEIVGNVVKALPRIKQNGEYRLNDGKSIHMITALLLHLIQSCSCNPSFFEAVRKLDNCLNADDSFEVSASLQALSNKLISTSRTSVETAKSSVAYFLKYLVGRAFPSHEKEKKSGIESDYKSVLELIVKESLDLITDPEWPAASTMMSVFFSMMRKSMEDAKAEAALKVYSLEFFGECLSKIHRLSLEASAALDALQNERQLSFLSLKTQLACADVTPHTSAEDLLLVCSAESLILQYLDGIGAAEYSVQTSIGFAISMWLQRVHSRSEDKILDTLTSEFKHTLLLYCSIYLRSSEGKRFASVNLKAYDYSAEDLFPQFNSKLQLKSGFNLDSKVARAVCFMLDNKQPFYLQAEFSLSLILNGLRSETISVRSRAIKTLAEAASVDKSILTKTQLMAFVKELLLQDASPTVRDSTVQFLTGVLTTNYSQEVSDQYLPILIDRLRDVSVAVRKRVVKLLITLYQLQYSALCSEPAGRQLESLSKTGILSSKLLIGIVDEEESIKDLTLRSISDIWLKGLKSGRSIEPDIVVEPADGTHSELVAVREGYYKTLSPVDKHDIVLRVRIIMQAIAEGDSISLLEQGLQRLASGKVAKVSRRDVLGMISILTECAAEQVLLQEEANDREKLYAAMQLLNVFSTSCPKSVTSYIKMLHIQMKTTASSQGPATPTSRSASEAPPTPVTPSKASFEESRISDDKIVALSANILKNAIPLLQSPDQALMGRIEQDLIGMLSNRSLTVLVAAVPCLCTLVLKATRNYHKIVRVLRTCYETLKKVRPQLSSPNGLNSSTMRHIARCLVIGSNLIRHFDFDGKNTSLAGNEQAMAEINQISVGGKSITESVYEVMLAFTSTGMPQLTSYSLLALGHIFTSHPRIMLRDDARALMDRVFQSGEIQQRVDLIKLFEEFLVAEQSKIDTVKEEKLDTKEAGRALDIKVLVGNAEEMGDAGVSSQLMQLYLERILWCMLSTNTLLSTAAFNVVALITEQGLVHPLDCLPSLVAVQAHPDASIRDRACIIYDKLAAKYDSFIHTKNSDCVKKVFEYLCSLRTQESFFEDPSAWISGYMRTTLVIESTAQDTTVAVLESFYSRIPEKYGRKMDFIVSQIRRIVDCIPREEISMNDVIFARFIAENFAFFDYKSFAEVQRVVIGVEEGLAVLSEDVLKEVDETLTKCSAEGVDELDSSQLITLAFRCSCIAILLVLKSNVLKLYNLSESKCRKFAPKKEKGRQGKQADKKIARTEILNWMFKEYVESDYMIAKDSMSEDEAEEADVLAETVEARTVEDDAPGSHATTPAKRRKSTSGRQSSGKRKQSRTFIG
ncbi:Sister chromatid cohesion protein 2 [Phlyctochytrium planicorne]|nr:Sister chromatid cohesion protein 2 [Phlyctochytrium planicorne]